MWDDGGESERLEASPPGTLGHHTAVCDLLNPLSRGEESHDYHEITTLFLVACTH